MWITEAVTQMAIGLLATVGSAVLAAVGNEIVGWIRGYRKQHADSRATEVVMECLEAAVANIVPKAALALEDGKITTEELKAIKDEALGQARIRLGKLTGFIREDMDAWIRVKMDSMIAIVLRSVGVDVIGPNDEAQETTKAIGFGKSR